MRTEAADNAAGRLNDPTEERVDGDALNLILVPDNRMYQQMKRLSPHLYTLDLRKPRAISANLKMPSPVITTIANWLNGDGRSK